MIQRPITYTNPFTDQEVTETHYFHLSKSALLEMNMEEHKATYNKDGKELTGMAAHLQRISDAEDGPAVIAEFKKIIRRAYGRKDGDKFIQNSEVWAQFEGSPAYDQLLWDLYTNPEAMAEFANALMPKNLEQEAERIAARVKNAQEAEITDKTDAERPNGSTSEKPLTGAIRAKEIFEATPENPVILTEAEMRERDSDDLKSGLATGRYKLS